jgi:hypothetical protein
MTNGPSFAGYAGSRIDLDLHFRFLEPLQFSVPVDSVHERPGRRERPGAGEHDAERTPRRDRGTPTVASRECAVT